LIIPIFIIPVIFIRIIRSKLILRFGYLESSGIGHFAQPVDLYLSEIDHCIHKTSNTRLIDLWCFESVISNKILASKWKKYFKIFPWFIIKPIITVNKMLPGHRLHEVPYRYLHDKYGLPWQYQDYYEVYKKSKCHFSFTSLEKKKAIEILKTVNIYPQDKIVTFNIRDIAFHGFNSDNYRNSDVKIIEPAIEILAKLNYKVLRMGKKVLNPLSINHKNIIDYANSLIKSELLDLFFISKCQFHIDTGSGLGAVAAMFRRPTIFINFPEIHYVTIHPTDLFIPKHFWSIEEKRMLSFREIVKIKAHYFSDDTHFKKAKIELVDNTPNEISDAIIEMEKRINKTWDRKKDEDKLQNKFKLLWQTPQNTNGKCIPRISYNFIKNNSYYLS